MIDPYRSGGGGHEGIELLTTCVACGNACSSQARVCPHCAARFESVRCQRCFSLQQPGGFTCLRCTQPLDLEPLLEVTQAPCPRCHGLLEAPGVEDPRLHECPRCGGMFVPPSLLAEILAASELGSRFSEGPPRMSLDDVRYVGCPMCSASMNRVNFGRVSGVIVDVCRPHGTWFDPGGLTRVVAFAASGGLTRTRAREKEDQDAEPRDETSRSRGP